MFIMVVVRKSLPSVGVKSDIRIVVTNSFGVLINSLGVLLILEKSVSFTENNSNVTLLNFTSQITYQQTREKQVSTYALAATALAFFDIL